MANRPLAPTFEAGKVIGARKLNDLSNLAGRMALRPGEFTSSEGSVQRPLVRQRGAAGAGRDGASGTFLCTLADDIAAANGTTEAGSGNGTVYSIGGGGEFTELGSRTIHNPYLSLLPAAGAGETIQYTCAKTYEHNPGDEETEEDDEFTVVGIDPLRFLASRDNFGEKKSLAVGEGGTTPDDIAWLGEECEEGS